MSERKTFTQAVLDYLTARPGIYVSAVALESVGGRQAWRSRVAEARLILQAEKRGTIKNRQQRKTDAHGRVWTISEYAFLPASPVEEWEPVTLETYRQVGLLGTTASDGYEHPPSTPEAR